MSDEVCHVLMRDLKPCGRQTYKDKKECIFHLENKSDEEAKIFDKEFWKELERMEKDNAIKELDFTRFIFTKEISFKNHLFEKTVFFQGAQFNKADFIGAKFNNNAQFSNVQFNNVAQFQSAQFNNEVYFVNAYFNNEAYFLEAQFNKEANFGSAQFNKEAYFRFAKFNKPRDVRFRNIDLSNVSFLNTDVSEVEFLDEKWARKNGRLAVIDETCIGKDWASYGAVAQLYRRLRRNYESNYRFEDAGNFFIGEMEMRRLDVAARFRNKNKLFKRIELLPEFSLLNIYKYLSLYGENYIRPTIWAIIIIVIYPFVDNLLSYWIFNKPLINYSDDFINVYPLRSSIASFFQMDSTYIIERIIGIPILGLLFIALKRKFERKK